MRLEDMLIRREEVKIDPSKKKNIEFVIPIHPQIINDGLGFTDKKFCKEALKRALKPYFEDMKKYVGEFTRNGKPESLLLRSTYLVRDPEITEREGIWVVTPPGWRATTEGNILYTLVINEGKLVPESKSTIIGSNQVGFTREKFREYMADSQMHSSNGYIGINGYAMVPKNIKTVPQALLLRAWAVEYMNTHLKQIKGLYILDNKKIYIKQNNAQ
ncbi:MAG: hypothetical protein V1645_01620 [archaeon]